jgi:hypothetical protein
MPVSRRAGFGKAVSTRRALEKFVQCIYSGNDGPGRDRQKYGEKQSFNGKFPTLFPCEITSG